jgi:hypothetical protein
MWLLSQAMNAPGLDLGVVVMRGPPTLSPRIQQGFAARNTYVFTVKEKL